MIKILYNTFFTDDVILFCWRLGDVIFSRNETDIVSVDLNINLDDTNFYEDDPKINVGILPWHNKYKHHARN